MNPAPRENAQLYGNRLTLLVEIGTTGEKPGFFVTTQGASQVHSVALYVMAFVQNIFPAL